MKNGKRFDGPVPLIGAPQSAPPPMMRVDHPDGSFVFMPAVGVACIPGPIVDQLAATFTKAVFAEAERRGLIPAETPSES